MKRAFPQLVLAGAVFFVYGQALFFDFVVLDDPIHIYKNPLMAGGGLAHLKGIWLHLYRSLYVPLTFTVWGFLTAVSTLFFSGEGLRVFNGSVFHPFLFHAVNVLLHTLSTVFLVYPLLNYTIRDRFCALLGALCFAIHPLQVEAVSWVSGLKDTLATFCGLVAAVFYARVHVEEGRGNRAPQLLMFSAMAFVLALLSKPSVVVLPLVMGIISVVFWGRDPRKVFREMMLATILTVPVVGITMVMQRDSGLDMVIQPFWTRLVLACDTITFYLQKILFPHPLVLEYSHTPEVALSSPFFWLSALIPVVISAVIWCKRLRMAGALWLCFALALLPVLGIKPFAFQMISTTSDRYIYGWMWIPGLTVGLLVQKYGRRMKVVTVLYFTVLFAMSFVQVRRWRDSETILKYTVEKNPQAWVSWNNLGVFFEARGDRTQAIRFYQQSASIHPSVPAWANIGAIYLAYEDLDRAEEAFIKAIETNPKEPIGYGNLGYVYRRKGELARAKVVLNRALELDPTFEIARRNLIDIEGILVSSNDHRMNRRP